MMAAANKRRPKEDVAFDKMHIEAKQENRTLDRILRLKRAAPEVSARAERSMSRELQQEAEKDRRRRISSGFEDWLAGRDTQGAREVRELLGKVGAMKNRLAAAGDPANLTGHKPPVRLSREEQKRRAKEKRGRFVSFFDGTGKKVTVDLKKNPIAGIYRSGGISAPQFAAAGQFQRDYDTSQYASMRSRGFEPGVDGGKAVMANLNAVAAQKTLGKLKDKLGPEPYALMVAVIGLHISFAEIHANGGDEVKVLSDRLRIALNKAATFYSFQAAEPETRTLRALQDLLRKMAAEVGEFTA